MKEMNSILKRVSFKAILHLIQVFEKTAFFLMAVLIWSNSTDLKHQSWLTLYAHVATPFC